MPSQSCQGYQFWTKANECGEFTIMNIRAGNYNLFAWVPGFIGDYRCDVEICISSGLSSCSNLNLVPVVVANRFCCLYVDQVFTKCKSRLWCWRGWFSVWTSKRWSYDVGNWYSWSLCSRILHSWPKPNVYQQTLCQSSRQVSLLVSKACIKEKVVVPIDSVLDWYLVNK